MADTPSSTLYGASCLPDLAKYLKCEPTKNQTIDAVAERYNQYVLAHFYLDPVTSAPVLQDTEADVKEAYKPQYRLVLRENIHKELLEHKGIKLHDCAYIIPVFPAGSVRETAEAVWVSLMCAGVQPEKPNEPSLWETGDVVYVHYSSIGQGMCVLAAAPVSGCPLPNAVSSLL